MVQIHSIILEADRLGIEFNDDEISTYSDEPAGTVLVDKRIDNDATTDNRSEVSSQMTWTEILIRLAKAKSVLFCDSIQY
jgi:hypothetical protein